MENQKLKAEKMIKINHLMALQKEKKFIQLLKTLKKKSDQHQNFTILNFFEPVGFRTMRSLLIPRKTKVMIYWCKSYYFQKI